jgi:hypothetical protein
MFPNFPADNFTQSSGHQEMVSRQRDTPSAVSLNYLLGLKDTFRKGCKCSASRNAAKQSEVLTKGLELNEASRLDRTTLLEGQSIEVRLLAESLPHHETIRCSISVPPFQYSPIYCIADHALTKTTPIFKRIRCSKALVPHCQRLLGLSCGSKRGWRVARGPAQRQSRRRLPRPRRRCRPRSRSWRQHPPLNHRQPRRLPRCVEAGTTKTTTTRPSDEIAGRYHPLSGPMRPAAR